MSLDLNMNRLNLPNMVDRQLKSAVIPTETYFNPLIIMGKRKTLEQKPRHNSALKAEIETSVNSIVATVHRKLKTQQRPRKAAKSRNVDIKLPFLEAVKSKTVDMKMPLSEERSKEDLRETKSDPKTEPIPKLFLRHKAEHNEFKSSLKNSNLQHSSVLPLKSTSIPQIKAKRDQRQQQRMRRSIPKYNEINDAMHQKRILEVKKQKRILEDMLMQHQRLQRDRHSIAMEIQSMREHLSDIRNKLDVSLKKLSTRPTVCQNMTRPKMLYAKPLSNVRQTARKTVSPARNKQRPLNLERRFLKRSTAQISGRALNS